MLRWSYISGGLSNQVQIWIEQVTTGIPHLSCARGTRTRQRHLYTRQIVCCVLHTANSTRQIGIGKQHMDPPLAVAVEGWAAAAAGSARTAGIRHLPWPWREWWRPPLDPLSPPPDPLSPPPAGDGSALIGVGSALAATTIRGVQEELLQGVVFYGGVDVAQAAGMAPASSDGGHGTRTRHGRPRRRGSAGAWRRRRGVAA